VHDLNYYRHYDKLWSVCAWIHLPIFFHLSFLNFCAGNVEFTKDIIVSESSSDPNGCTAGKDQNHDLSKIAVDARCSECLNGVISLNTLYFYVNH
jgi:hypothetical protein